MGSALTDEAQIIIAAIRNPENKDNLLVQDVMINSIPAKALCWVEHENSDVKLSPMVIVVNPALFDKIEVVNDSIES